MIHVLHIKNNLTVLHDQEPELVRFATVICDCKNKFIPCLYFPILKFRVSVPGIIVIQEPSHLLGSFPGIPLFPPAIPDIR